jgi:hypothetical protein
VHDTPYGILFIAESIRDRKLIICLCCSIDLVTTNALLYAAAAAIGLEILSMLVFTVGRATGARMIPHRGKHLDTFETVDLACITFNKVCAGHNFLLLLNAA